MGVGVGVFLGTVMNSGRVSMPLDGRRSNRVQIVTESMTGLEHEIYTLKVVYHMVVGGWDVFFLS